MANRTIILSPGDKFGCLSVVSEVEKNKFNKRQFLCRCECGQSCTVLLENLRSGHTKSCGCNKITLTSTEKKTHGFSRTRLYGIWAGMKNRCYNPNVKSFKDYGAKGVRVCDDWQEFAPFCDWALKNGYQNDLTIDRKNPFGNYEPRNCRWATRKEQRMNRRDSVVLGGPK